MKSFRKIFWVGLMLLSGAMPLMAQQNYLDISRSDDAGDGTSWATAYKSLSNAVAKMPAAGVTNLWVAKGTYIVANVDIKTNSLFGGYPTGGGVRDWTNNLSVFDGNFTNRCLQKTTAGTAFIEGITIQNGSNSAAGCALNVTAGSINAYNCAFTNNKTLNDANGAAVFVSVAGSSNTFVNCLFYTNSTVMASGGGIYLGAGTHQLYGCVFSNNVALNYGGAVYVTGGGVTISNCDFIGNYGGNNYRGAGGISFQNVAGTNVIINSRFNSNIAVTMGGAIQIAQNTASYNPLFILRGCVFYNNRAPNGGAIALADQGAIYNSTVQCIDCSFSNNTGKACWATLGEIRMTGCDMVNNPAGAINWAGGSIFSSCSFVSNTAGSGGAINLAAATTNIFVNCTFLTNRASAGTGGAIYSGNAGNQMAVSNCIFWGNTSSSTGTNIQNAGTVSIAYSLIGTNVNQVNGGTKNFGSGIINANPLFASIVQPYDMHLQSQYGRWTSGGWTTDASTSPAIDTGDPTMSPALEPQPNGGRINMGAYGGTIQASKSAASGMHVVNDYATNVTASSVTLCGQVMTTNEATATAYIFYGETDAFSNKAAWGFFTTNGLVTGVAGFTSTVEVASGKLYFWRCYLSNSTSEAWAQASNTFLTAEITVQTSDNGAAEGGNTGAFTISRPFGTSLGPLSVNYQMSGTALNGTDYQLLSGNVVMDTGALSTTILVTAYNDLFAQQYEPDETVVLTLTTGAYLIGAQSNATVTITNDSTTGLCYVDVSMADDTGNGLSWATACKSITNGIRRAGYGQIWVAQGTYIVANVDIKTNSFYGGYPTGGGTRDWANNLTILDANFTNRALQKATGSEASVIDGFTIRNGTNTTGSGGFYGSAGSIILNNCTFTNNINSGSGGAVYMNVAGVTNVFSNCLFIANSSGNGGAYHGGAIFLYSVGFNSFYGCAFVSNIAPYSTGAGGAILENGVGGVLNLYNCVFSNNIAGNAGAIYSQGNRIYASNTVFFGNRATNTLGGAIQQYRAGSTNSFVNCSFITNYAKTAGGALQFNYATTPIHHLSLTVHSLRIRQRRPAVRSTVLWQVC